MGATTEFFIFIAALGMKLLIICIVVLSAWSAYGQTVTVRGILINQKSEAPIGYANIGIVDTPVGTISNEDGTFEIDIPEKFQERELLFSALGFERRSFLVRNLKENENVITLQEHVTVLQNLTVKSSRSRPALIAELGNQYSNEGSIYADSSAAGSAMALLIERRPSGKYPGLKPPYHVTKARLRIAHNTFEVFKIRLRFLSVDSVTGMPGNDLVNQNIIATSEMRKGWLDFDLTRHDIRIKVPQFFIVFEWLLEDQDRVMLVEQYAEFRRQYPRRVTVDTLQMDGQKIAYNSWRGFRAGTSFGSSSAKYSLENYKTYYRTNSYGKWKRSSFILAAQVTLANYD